MAQKTAPISLRLDKRTDRLISEEARRTKRSKGAVIESLAEEALTCRLFPGIAFRGDDYDRRPWILGTALDVWQVIEAYRDFGSAEKIAKGSELDPRQIRLALAYYERFPEEIDEAIRRNNPSIEELRESFPEADFTLIDE